MKHFFLTILIAGFVFNLTGTHTTQAHFEYNYLQTLQNGSVQYRITLHYTRDCKPGSITFGDQLSFGIYDKTNGQLYQSVNATLTSRITTENCYKQCEEKVDYEQIVTLPVNDSGYFVTNQLCCRVSSTNLLENQNGQPDQGTTAFCFIPGKVVNNNAKFSIQSITSGLVKTDTIKYYLTDIENDSVSVEITSPNIGASLNINFPEPEKTFKNLAGVTYKSGYGSTFPLGNSTVFKIDQNTQQIMVRGALSGTYFIAFSIKEFRQGKLVGHTIWETVIYITTNVPSPNKFHLEAWPKIGPAAALHWTYCEQNIRYQIVERSTDSINFTPIDTISLNPRTYFDYSVVPNKKYFYKIRAAHYDGSFVISDTAAVQTWRLSINENVNNNALNILISPMPVSEICKISTVNTHIVSYTIIDHTGRVVFTEVLTGERDTIQLDCSGFPPGLYFISLTTPSGTQMSRKLIKL